MILKESAMVFLLPPLRLSLSSLCFNEHPKYESKSKTPSCSASRMELILDNVSNAFLQEATRVLKIIS